VIPSQARCLELFGGHLRFDVLSSFFDVLSSFDVEARGLAALSLNRRGALFGRFG